MTALMENRPVDSTAEAPEGSAPASLNRMLAADLHHAISDSLNFAAPVSDNVPPVAVVHLEVTAEQLIAVATNRFVLGVTTVEYSGHAFNLTIGIEDAKVLARMAKTAKRDERLREVVIEIAERQATFRFTTGEAMTLRDTDTDFPKWRQLIPADDRHMGLAKGYGYDPNQLIRFGKVHRKGNGRMVMYGTLKEDRPGLTVVHIGEHFVGAIMPARHPNDSEETYSVPPWLAGQ